MDRNEQPLSVSEVFELQPGTDNEPTWINPGMVGVARSIEKKIGQSGKPRWAITWADQSGSATVESAMFSAPKFGEGDVVQMEGGMRRTEYNGKAQVSFGKSTTFNVVGKSAHHEEQKERAASGAPAVNGQPQMQNGQAVGNAIKEAHAHLRCLYTPAELREMMKRPGLYWDAAYEFASDQLRISRLLEHGKLKPSIKEREGRLASAKAAPQPAPAPTPAPKPGPEGSAFQTSEGEDIDCPF